MAAKKFVVRCYDGFDNQWCDCTKPISEAEAKKVLSEKTGNGTHHTSFADIDYYAIFPADTRMLYSNGFGENVREYEPQEEVEEFTMGKTKDILKKRKKELEDQLQPFYAIKQELEEVNKALGALETDCRGCDSGCDICRTGMRYR